VGAYRESGTDATGPAAMGMRKFALARARVLPPDCVSTLMGLRPADPPPRYRQDPGPVPSMRRRRGWGIRARVRITEIRLFALFPESEVRCPRCGHKQVPSLRRRIVQYVNKTVRDSLPIWPMNKTV